MERFAGGPGKEASPSGAAGGHRDAMNCCRHGTSDPQEGASYRQVAKPRESQTKGADLEGLVNPKANLLSQSLVRKLLLGNVRYTPK